jgi:hypothetical protein
MNKGLHPKGRVHIPPFFAFKQEAVSTIILKKYNKKVDIFLKNVYILIGQSMYERLGKKTKVRRHRL